MKEKDSRKPDASFTMGAIALIFLAIGYQTALFIQKAAVAKVVGNADRPDTVYVYGNMAGAGTTPDMEDKSTKYATGESATRSSGAMSVKRRNSDHSPAATAVREKAFEMRPAENFAFDPNTVSKEDLVRLGFSPKQAASIDNYRKAGGRFRRKEDFARSYVVDEDTYERLEAYIEFAKTDLNKADSAAFDALPGIGPYYAARMVSYREELGGYSSIEQLLEIPKFDKERLEKIRDMVTLSPPRPLRLWSLPEDSLSRHPYLDRHSAHSIVLFRENTPREQWTVKALEQAGAISGATAGKLERCVLE